MSRDIIIIDLSAQEYEGEAIGRKQKDKYVAKTWRFRKKRKKKWQKLPKKMLNRIQRTTLN